MVIKMRVLSNNINKSIPVTMESLLFRDLDDERRRDILVAAAKLFARLGFRTTSMRAIAESVGILGGSLYHHFASKEELFLTIHGEALRVAKNLLVEAAAAEKTPWSRLDAVCRMHFSIQVDPQSVTLPLMDDLSAISDSLRNQVIEQRNSFEEYYRELIEQLPMKPDIDRDIFRVNLLILLNNAARWYQPNGRLTLNEVGEAIFKIFEQSKRDAT